MKTLSLIGLLAVACRSPRGCSQADLPKIEARKASELAKLAQDVKSTNTECGTSIKVAFEWKGVQEADLSSYSASGWCEAALDAIRRVCADAPGRDAVKEKIKSVTCGFGPDRAVSLTDGTVHYKISFKSTNDADFIFESLENAL